MGKIKKMKTNRFNSSVSNCTKIYPTLCEAYHNYTMELNKLIIYEVLTEDTEVEK